MIAVLLKMILCGILAHVIVKLIKHVKFMNILDIKNWSCEKRLIDNISLACEHEILNTTGASLDDKKVNC